MTDDEGPRYQDGDIVWVKLGPCWWPGEVTENGPEDFTTKKPPLAIVKFFNETTYEFVKSYNHIYAYNCERKNEFIKKGMDSFRANNSHMEKFPGDVSLAELRTDGNPNILSDPMFAPQKKSNVIAEVFGSPSPKKAKDGKHKRASTSKSSAKKSTKVNITHRRFLGCDDYEAHIRLQYPGKDTEHLSSDEEILRLNAEPTQNFNCSQCPFNTNRLEVMLFHVQCHIKGIASHVQVRKKTSPKKKKQRVILKPVILSDDDRTNSSAGYLDTDSEEEVKPKLKRKKKTQASPKKTKPKKEEEEETVVAAAAADIRTHLLAEWSDSEENEEVEVSKTDTSGESLENRTHIVEDEDKDKDKEKESKSDEQTGRDLKSCFDFDEEEEEEDNNIVHAAAAGRKIPRVIPPSDKRKSTDPDNDDASLPLAEDDKSRMNILKDSENFNDSSDSIQNESEPLKEEKVFQDLMETTVVPDLPEVPDTTKPQQNFSDGKTVKIPDKKTENVTEVATKLTNPKKRFVKSFEDFELLQNEQRKAQEEKEEELRKEKAVVVEPIEQIIETPCIETSQVEPSKAVEPPQVESPLPVVEPEPLPVVDSLEALSAVESSQVESPQVEDPQIEETGSVAEESKEKSEEKNETDSLVMEAIEPIQEQTFGETELENETKIEDESNDVFKKIDANLQISKLKCQIMSKLSDEELESPKALKTKSSHRTPRSKILESYRNDRFKEEKVQKSIDETDEENKKEHQEHHPPKKSKYLKFNQEESENIEKIEEEPNKSDVLKEIEAIPEKNPDEEIGKINQIDEYLNDFLFNIPKTSESPKVTEKEKEEVKDGKSLTENEKHKHEVQIKCASSEENEADLAISIKTNLSNFNKNEEEMSALSTLAMVSQLETTVEEPAKEEKNVPKPVKPLFEQKPESELVPIDGNLTVVSEKDLADAQVEITANASPTCKKPVTLTNFSMDFSEGNSNSTSDSLTSESKEEEMRKVPGPEDIFDIEEHIPSQIVDKVKPVKELSPSPSSKLLERLTEPKTKENSTPKFVKVPMTKESTKISKTKFVVKQAAGAANKIIKGTVTQSNKPIILSEKIIKPMKQSDSTGSVSVQKITSKRNLQDPDEIDTFIIQKGTKTVEEDEELELSMNEDEIPVKKFKKNTVGMDPKKLQVSSSATSVKKRGKAKILQQTIITPAGEIIQPTVTTAATVVTSQDDNVFDINSMPIVLSDQILTPESIENMPIYLSDSVQSTPEPLTPTTKVQTNIVKKTPVTVQQNKTPMRVLNKSVASPAGKLVTTPKILSTVGSKLIKNSLPTASSKHGKYVIVTQPSSVSSGSKYTVGKKQIVKRVSGDVALTSAGTLTKVQNVTPEPTGNKIMIYTNEQGQQQRVLLTPAQQKKMIGYQIPGAKLTKTVVKGNIIQKTKDSPMTAIPSSSGLISKTPTSRINSNQTLITSSGHVLTPIHPQQAKTMRLEKPTITGRKIQMQSQRVSVKPPQQKTVLIRNQHGQTVRRIQGTDDELLEKQVAEQLEAIKAKAPKTIRRSYAKKVEIPPKPTPKSDSVVPPLAPISPKKTEMTTTTTTTQPDGKQERALHQLVIQDAMGNQTTITEGQILALPSETIDGQPQSYMLVTLDESGNLTPLNNEALLSLDPNLGLGSDLGNTVLQIDQSASKEEVQQEKEEEKPTETVQEQVVDSSSVMHSMGGESGQQLIVTGDPIAAQKFLESLTEGNTDLANILASAEGSSILIHADGQQILINTDSDNQMMLSVNTDSLNMGESSEGGGNPIFATQPAKNQDILAAALADTDVFQQEQNGTQGKVSQLSPNSTLYPMNVGGLETSLTLNSPIMTPLEVPSTNSKKISDENDILNQVPKNVDLPITITDPNISQTVSQQQVASLMVNELQSNLELTLPISDSAITAASSEMNSPSFVYSLPSLEGADINQKPFNSSMPLLTEDTEEVMTEESKEEKTEPLSKPNEEKEETTKISPEGSFLDESEGLCTLGGEMCSSLSEPPPDMFDLSAVLSSHQMKTSAPSPKQETKSEELVIMEEAELKMDDKGGDESVSSESVNPDTASVTETSSPNTMNEDSCEIPVQPNIVTTLNEDVFGEVTTEEKGCKRGPGDEEVGNDNKKCKFD